MKNLMKYLTIMLCTVMLGLSVASCSDDDNDEPSASVGKVNIVNKSSYTLDGFVVHFTNDKGEIVTREEKGTLKVNESINVDIPIGATYYYMSTALGGTRFFSVDYAVSVKSQVLTDQVIGYWSANL